MLRSRRARALAQPYDAPGLKVDELRSVAMTPAGDLVLTESDEGRVRVVRGIP